MAIDLLSYTGNAALGAGSNADIPVGTNVNLDQVNQAARDMMMLDNERNVRLYQQKIADRNKLNDLILNNQVAVGEILPEYQPIYDKAAKDVEKAYVDWGGDFNNTKGYRDYISKVKQLQDVATHAQVRTKSIQDLKQQMAKETLPFKQKEMQSHLDKELKKGFWDQVNPYQQMYNFSTKPILDTAVQVKSTVRNPNDPAQSTEISVFDYNDAIGRARAGMLNDDEASESIRNFRDEFEKYSTTDRSQTIGALNRQLEKYNNDVGLATLGRPLQQGDKSFAPPIKTVAEQGQLFIDESPETLAAKYAIASQPSFVSSTPKFDKDLGKYQIDKAKLSLDAKKLGIDAMKANAYVRQVNANVDKIRKSLEAQATNIGPQYQKFIGAIDFGGLKTSGGKVDGSLDLINVNRLSQGDQFINGPVVDKKTGKITVGRLEPFTTTKGKAAGYYIPRYIDPVSGTQINISNLPPEMKEGYEITKRKKNITVEDYLKGLLYNGAIDMVVEGKNGSVNYTDMWKSASLLNSLGTSKGEENMNILPPESSYNQNQ